MWACADVSSALNFFCSILVFNFNYWLISCSSYYFQRTVIHVRLYTSISEITFNEILGIKYSVVFVHGSLRLGRISDKMLCFGECHVRWSCILSLVVCDNFHAILLLYSYAWICSSEVNSYSLSRYALDPMISLHFVLNIGFHCLFTFDWNNHDKFIPYTATVGQIFSLLHEIITALVYNTERKEGALRKLFLKQDREIRAT